MYWKMIWLTTLGLVLCSFAVMSVVVSFLGARDIRKLFDRLQNGSDQDVDSSE